MALLSRARVTAFGRYVPERVMTNADLEKIVDTSNEWIVQRTGIVERRVAAADEYTSHMCQQAALDLQRANGANLRDVDYIVTATVTPDYPFPSVAALIQHRLGIENAAAIDISAACAGFVHGLNLANALVSSGTARKVLVLAGESLSKILDYSDRATCILFGDGAAAALVEAADAGAFLAVDADTDGAMAGELYCTGLCQSMGQTRDEGRKVRQNGRAVYRWAVSTIPEAIRRLLDKAGLGVDDIDWFIPHSANLRIIESICETTGIGLEKTLTSIQRFGNTSSASIPLALTPAIRDGRVRPGQTLLMVGFGGGLVWAGNIIRL